MTPLSRRRLLQAALPLPLVTPDLLAAPPLDIPPSGPVDLRRGPYLQMQGPTRLVVRWRTGAGVRRSLLRLGDTHDALRREVEAVELPTPFRQGRDWIASLDDLRPAHEYAYAIDADGTILAGADEAHKFRTAPPVGTATPLRFWVLGDCGTNRVGTGNAGKAVAARNGFRRYNAGKPLDGVLLPGDNAYSHGTDAQYQTALFSVYRDELLRLPCWPAIGNHEMTDDYFHLFSVPTRGEVGGVPSGSPNYYAFDHANVHFVVLDLFKAPWRDADAPQWRWLDRDLAANRQEWTVVVCHFSPYCKGKYDSDKIEYLADVRRRLLPPLEAHGVDVLLTGHDHTYQRSYLVHGHHGKSDTFDAARHLAAPGDGREKPWTKRRAPHTGLVVVVTGTAGAEDPIEKPDARGGKLDHPALVPIVGGHQGGRGLRRLGTFLLEVTGRTLSGRQIDDRGNVVDHFTLVRPT